ncbi:uncharacterized protein LOC126484890 [Schistocerca serialis cubense]|uniref:uncharacterized protein LOC126484890 n=1 Tax=Schistocerca serialis cubense TaxID=2023355 RepID=UPI00214E4537|nr:uncharacterized protein LOC126484890 [Schistocerca serialis cubense]
MYQKAAESSRPPQRKPRTNRPPPPSWGRSHFPILGGKSDDHLIIDAQAPDTSVTQEPPPAPSPTTTFAAAAQCPPAQPSSVMRTNAHQAERLSAVSTRPPAAVPQPSIAAPSPPATMPTPDRRRVKQPTQDVLPVMETNDSFWDEM